MCMTVHDCACVLAWRYTTRHQDPNPEVGAPSSLCLAHLSPHRLPYSPALAAHTACAKCWADWEDAGGGSRTQGGFRSLSACRPSRSDFLIQERSWDTLDRAAGDRIIATGVSVRFPQCPVCQRAIEVSQGYADKANPKCPLRDIFEYYSGFMPSSVRALSGAVPLVPGGSSAVKVCA